MLGFPICLYASGMLNPWKQVNVMLLISSACGWVLEVFFRKWVYGSSDFTYVPYSFSFLKPPSPYPWVPLFSNSHKEVLGHVCAQNAARNSFCGATTIMIPSAFGSLVTLSRKIIRELEQGIFWEIKKGDKGKGKINWTYRAGRTLEHFKEGLLLLFFFFLPPIFSFLFYFLESPALYLYHILKLQFISFLSLLSCCYYILPLFLFAVSGFGAFWFCFSVFPLITDAVKFVNKNTVHVLFVLFKFDFTFY